MFVDSYLFLFFSYFHFVKDNKEAYTKNGKTYQRSIIDCPKCHKQETSKHAKRHLISCGFLNEEISDIVAAASGRKAGPRRARRCLECRKIVLFIS